jgi:disulfide bond formation protein DsbB
MKRSVGIVAAMLLLAAACGGGSGGADEDGGVGGDAGDRPAPTIGVSVAQGKSLYDGTCQACHAEGGVGVEGLGKPLAGSEFVSGLSDPELVEFIKAGRDTSDPENTSGVAMPPKGGNPALTDADLESIVAYLRSLN